LVGIIVRNQKTAIRISLFCYKPRGIEDKIGCSLVYSFFSQMSPKNKIRFLSSSVFYYSNEQATY